VKLCISRDEICNSFLESIFSIHIKNYIFVADDKCGKCRSFIFQRKEEIGKIERYRYGNLHIP